MRGRGLALRAGRRADPRPGRARPGDGRPDPGPVARASRRLRRDGWHRDTADRAATDPARRARAARRLGLAWIDTGDPVPAGMDTVVERERVRIDADGSAWTTGPVPRGRHVRAVGEDFQAGQMLIPSGRWLRPGDLAAAARPGKPRSRSPGSRSSRSSRPGMRSSRSAQAGPGDIVDSNSVLLAARAVRSAPGPSSPMCSPTTQQIAAEVRRASLTADLVLMIAGSSVGHNDHTAAVLAHVGGLAVSKVAVRPGHPVLLGYARRRRT